MTNMLYYGWLGHRNLGDEALFAVNRRLFPHIHFIRADAWISQVCAQVAKRAPWLPRLLTRLTGRPHSPMLPMSARIYKPSACMLGGGTFINHHQRVAARIAAIQQEMPFIIFGAGVRTMANAVAHDPADRGWNAILEASPFVTVRGPDSLRALQEQGFHRGQVIGDPVLSLAEPTVVRRNGRRVGINLGDTSGQLWGGDDAAVYRACRDLAQKLIRAGFEVSLLSVYPKDTAIVCRLARECGDAVDVFVHYRVTPAVFDYYRSLDVFVGEKLHSVILAHCAYTPAIMLEYQPKCADYMASMDLQALNFRCNRLDVDELTATVIRLQQQHVEYQHMLVERIHHFTALQQEFVAQVSSYVEGVRP
jgi:polysaccharide pyruvyl transferase WcaK-like protein